MKPTLVIIQGGGCRQIECATGALMALDELNIQPDYYRAASAGSIVAALHASQLPAKQIASLIRRPVSDLFRSSLLQWIKLFVPGLTVDHVYDNAGVEAILSLYIKEYMTLQKVQVSATEYPSYASIMLPATIQSVMASSAIPEVFPPVEIGGKTYLDGGVINNIPMIPIASIPQYEHIYIILCNEDTKTNKRAWTKIGRSLQAINETMLRESHQVFEEGWDDLPNVTVIQPPPFRSHLLDWSEDWSLIAHSYNYTLDLINYNRAREAHAMEVIISPPGKQY
ncbi:MAG: patatin-like phospholipase family protein [Victivallaceae bacterium]